MESPLAQHSSSILLKSLHSDHNEKAPETDHTSHSSLIFEHQTLENKDSETKEIANTEATEHVQQDSAEETDRAQQISSFLSKLLDNVQQECQEPLLSLDAPSTSYSTSARDMRRPCVQKIDLEEAQDESECPSQSAPSPSVGRTNESSSESSVSSSEDEIVVPESPCSAGAPIFSIKYVLDFSTVKIDFGANFPGMTIEECLEITNKTNKDITVQLSVNCLNLECQQIGGYVYSMRRSLYFNISSQHEVVIKPQCSVSFTVILKSPRIKIQGDILGEIVASIKGVEEVERIGLSSSVYIPQIICPKELYSNETGCSILNLAINKKGKRLDTKFPLKNLSEIPVTLQLSFYQPKNVEEDSDLDCVLFPSTVTIPAKGLSVINLGLKNPKAIAKRTDQDAKTFKKVLIGTIKGCALIYSFLLCIELH